MPVYRPRNRLVNFRLSDEEYEFLRVACAQNGARSISDFARLAVLRQAGSDERQSASIQWRLSALGHKMSELESRVRHLLRLLESSSGDARGKPPERAGACN